MIKPALLQAWGSAFLLFPSGKSARSKGRMKFILPLLFVSLSSLTPLMAQTSQQMSEAAATELEVSDKAMNEIYQKLLKILNDEGKKRLRETQRAWVIYRDAQAGFDSHHFAGGTAERLEQLGSLNLLTKERTARLKEDYQRFREMSE